MPKSRISMGFFSCIWVPSFPVVARGGAHRLLKRGKDEEGGEGVGRRVNEVEGCYLVKTLVKEGKNIFYFLSE